MRAIRLMFATAVLGGGIAAGGSASAAPVPTGSAALAAEGAAPIEAVQWGGWGYGPGYGYHGPRRGYGPGYGFYGPPRRWGPRYGYYGPRHWGPPVVCRFRPSPWGPRRVCFRRY